VSESELRWCDSWQRRLKVRIVQWFAAGRAIGPYYVQQPVDRSTY